MRGPSLADIAIVAGLLFGVILLAWYAFGGDPDETQTMPPVRAEDPDRSGPDPLAPLPMGPQSMLAGAEPDQFNVTLEPSTGELVAVRVDDLAALVEPGEEYASELHAMADEIRAGDEEPGFYDPSDYEDWVRYRMDRQLRPGLYAPDYWDRAWERFNQRTADQQALTDQFRHDCLTWFA